MKNDFNFHQTLFFVDCNMQAGQYTEYPEQGYSWLFSVTSDKTQYSTSNEATADFFHIFQFITLFNIQPLNAIPN
jgi:hypothetical protein